MRTVPESERRRFAALYPDTHNSQLAAMFGLTARGVRTRAQRWGLHKTPAYRKAFNVAAARKNLGKTAWNKGIKNGRVTKTAFKAGNAPHNLLPAGTRRIREGYWVEKQPNGKWEQLARVIWRQHHGEIPKGKTISYKDGNKVNVDIDNLILSSSRENILKHSIHNYPAEVKTAIYQLASLKRLINRQPT